jgi:hypothetical protein
MRKKLCLLMCLASTSFLTHAQTRQLTISSNIRLPKDSIVANKLINSLNGFLNQKENENKTNSYVLKEDLLETSVLLDEFKNIEKSGKYKDDNFYKGYINSIVELDNNTFLVQFSHIGVYEKTPIMVASFQLLAKMKNDKFYFSSPLKHNTALWKIKKISDKIFHYKTSLNSKTILDYEKQSNSLDTKFNNPKWKIEWYGFNTVPELLYNMGVIYKIDYNGQKSSTFTARENNTFLILDGTGNPHFDTFDPHDLYHEKANSAIASDKLNPAMVCGSAYLYGGSWGISYKEILKTFKTKLTKDAKTDWLKLYRESYNFGDSEEKHLYVTQLINSLIIQKAEKEKGFKAVLELLGSGNFEENEDNFFKILESNSGINKNNFNEKIGALIKESK